MSAPTLGLVLAGGLARRMGGGDKALIRIGGTTILERVLDRSDRISLRDDLCQCAVHKGIQGRTRPYRPGTFRLR